MVYHDASLSRKIASLHSTLAVGVDNLGDRKPPRFYRYSNAANTEASTYDTLGRYFWSRLRVEFLDAADKTERAVGVRMSTARGDVRFASLYFVLSYVLTA